MTRFSTPTQHGHKLSRVAGGCPVTVASALPLSAHAVDAASSRPSVLATYPTQITEPQERFAGIWNLLGGKREQRQAIT